MKYIQFFCLEFHLPSTVIRTVLWMILKSDIQNILFKIHFICLRTNILFPNIQTWILMKLIIKIARKFPRTHYTVKTSLNQLTISTSIFNLFSSLLIQTFEHNMMPSTTTTTVFYVSEIGFFFKKNMINLFVIVIILLSGIVHSNLLIPRTIQRWYKWILIYLFIFPVFSTKF